MYVEILILASLAVEPRHGYEIRQWVEALLGGSYPLNNNQLYPVLKRFENEGAVTRSTESQQGRPEKHVYTLTEAGAEALRRLIADFPEPVAREDREFFTRVGLFDLIERPDRIHVLEMRARVLEQRLEATEERRRKVECSGSAYAAKVVALIGERRQHELEWIAELIEDEHDAEAEAAAAEEAE